MFALNQIVKEFKEFLDEYRVMGLAAAFIIGVAATSLIQSLVNNIIMPIVTVFLPKGEWQTVTLAVGPITIGWGAFLASLLNFLIIALLVFGISKVALKEAKATKK